MSPTWRSEDMPEHAPVGIAGGAFALLRGLVLIATLLLGVVVTLVLRLVEAPVHGMARPWTSWVTVLVCRIALIVLGLRVSNDGVPMSTSGAFVANHSSWLDIFVLNAGTPLVFVSKAEVADWPGIGWLARLTGTVFVERAAREAGQQKAILETRIAAGNRLLFFPEGTSSDGLRVLGFKPTLFAALFSGNPASVQPVTVAYHAPEGCDPRFYGWWGDMDFGPHLMQLLAFPRFGNVIVTWHPALSVADFPDRKALAKAAEAQVRLAHPNGADA